MFSPFLSFFLICGFAFRHTTALSNQWMKLNNLISRGWRPSPKKEKKLLPLLPLLLNQQAREGKSQPPKSKPMRLVFSILFFKITLLKIFPSLFPLSPPYSLPLQFVVDMMDILKKELMELIENLNSVKIWIQLNIPRVEGGDNFGVGIQVGGRGEGEGKRGD